MTSESFPDRDGDGSSNVVFSIFVPGVPAPKGSGSRVTPPGGRAVYIEAGTTRSRRAKKTWASAIADTARATYHGPPLSCAIEIDVSYIFLRPKSRRRLAETYHTIKPDLDKLHRAIFDPLTRAKVIKDDCVIASDRGEKIYTDNAAEAGARITLRRLGSGQKE